MAQSTEITITQSERAALLGIVNSQYHDGQCPVGSPVWSWSANCFDNKRIFGAVVASLIKKRLVDQSGEGEDATLAITQTGFDLVREA